MVSGYSSIKEGFASTPTTNSDEKTNEQLDRIKELEEELMKIKAELNNENNMETKITSMDEEINMDREELDERENELDIREKNLDNREKELDDREMKLDELDADSDIIKNSEEDKEDIMIEGFRGSSIMVKRYLSDLLKAILLGLIYYLMTSKDMFIFTKPIHSLVKKGMSHEILHTLIFVVLAYIVISLTF